VPPVTRVQIGKLGAGAEDWGLRIYSSTGAVMLDATGGGVTTEGIAGEAVTVTRRTAGAGPDTITTNEAVLGTLTNVPTSNAQVVNLRFTGIVSADPTDLTWTVRIRRTNLSGAVLLLREYTGGFVPVMFHEDTSPAEPTQTYVVTLDPGGGSNEVSVQDWSFVAQTFRR
jgi:hypothetical protein